MEDTMAKINLQVLGQDVKVSPRNNNSKTRKNARSVGRTDLNPSNLFAVHIKGVKESINR